MPGQGVLALPLSFPKENRVFRKAKQGKTQVVSTSEQMSLPRPPISLNTPIPNQPFSSPEVYYLEGNQGHLPLGAGLYIDPATGQFTNIEPSPYIYCTPQYGNLPVSYPPYDCETAVNTAGVTDFTDAWFNCQYLTEFPCVDSSSVTDFSYAWEYCYSLTNFPTINTSAGENFTYSWAYTGLTSFPKLNTSNGSIFYGTWSGCSYLASFPELDASKGEDFTYAWCNCTSLTSFPGTLNLSSGTTFYGAWYNCTSLTSFPGTLDLSSGINFFGAWQNCSSLTSFPGTLDLSSGTNFQSAWVNCSSLTSFPGTLDLSSGTNFFFAWFNCSSLTAFPAGMFNTCQATNFSSAWGYCALSQQSVDNILISLDTAGQSNGTVSLNGGTSSAPGAAGLAAKASLEGRGWTVLTN